MLLPVTSKQALNLEIRRYHSSTAAAADVIFILQLAISCGPWVVNTHKWSNITCIHANFQETRRKNVGVSSVVHVQVS